MPVAELVKLTVDRRSIPFFFASLLKTAFLEGLNKEVAAAE
jgi:hypothetical protein